MKKPIKKKPPTLADRAWEYRSRRVNNTPMFLSLYRQVERAWTAGYKAALRDSKRSVKR